MMVNIEARTLQGTDHFFGFEDTKLIGHAPYVTKTAMCSVAGSTSLGMGSPVLRALSRKQEGSTKRADLRNRRDHHVVTAFRHSLINNGVPIFLRVMLPRGRG
jgi:hypothetical protein